MKRTNNSFHLNRLASRASFLLVGLFGQPPAPDVTRDLLNRGPDFSASNYDIAPIFTQHQIYVKLSVLPDKKRRSIYF